MVTSSAVVGSSAIRMSGVASQRDGDHHALPQAAAELERVFIDTALRLRDADIPQQLDGAGAGGGARQASMLAHDLRDLVADGVVHAERRHRLLEDQSDPAAAHRAHLAAMRVERREVERLLPVTAAQPDVPGHDAPGPVDDAQDGARGDALATAALTDDAERAAAVHVEADAFQRANDALVLVKLDHQIFDRQQRRGAEGRIHP